MFILSISTDLLNPLKETSTDRCDAIIFGKEEVFTLTEVEAAIQGLKSGKAAGEDRRNLTEILKALNGEEVRWLTRVHEMLWTLGKTPKD